MLKVQRWLLENDFNFERLTEDFGIKVKKYNDRIVLNYSQIDSQKNDPIANECRSLILGYPNTTKILSRSFDRFLNYGEDLETDKFDISKSSTSTKEDGSIIGIYFDGHEMCISTRSMAFAEGETMRGTKYSDLVENVNINILKKIKTIVSPYIWVNCTFIFELCTRENRVVKQYDKDKLFLLAVRDKNTGRYLDDIIVDKISKGIDAERPLFLNFKNYDEIIKNIKKLPAMDEGYVCKIGDWRIKIKNPSYLAIHHLRDNGAVSNKRVSLLVWENDYDEYLGYFPEDLEFFQPYIEAYDEMEKDLNHLWDKYKDVESQKDFALSIKDSPTKSILFSMRNGKSKEEHIEKMTTNLKLEILNGYL